MLKLASRTVLAGLLGLALASVPSVSHALPRLCDVVCSCASSCSAPCSVTNGGYSVTTCGAQGMCRGACRATEPKSEFEAAVQAAEPERVASACADKRSHLDSQDEQATAGLLGE